MRVWGKSLRILLWLTLVAVGSSFVAPFAVLGAGVLGVWLVIGRENLWLRIIVIVAYLLPTLLFSEEYTPFSFMILLVLGSSILIGYLANMILKLLCNVPIPSMQFGLWEVGGWMLALSLVFTYCRLANIPPDYLNRFGIFVIVTSSACIALNVVLACCPFFIPKPLRFDELWNVAIVSQFLLMPLVEWTVCCVIGVLLMNKDSSTMGTIFFFLYIMHVIGIIFVMLVAYPMDKDGYFRDEATEKELT
ncbi:hypothetical protein C5Y96_08035 [Blastopirellula marina]|uniref:Uncharacterized protein n=2 Tax=Pirellulales TaxID=2691354 RepID=A0A2S8FY45_9BACT|nr:hypothetical protein C5Y96_08035 [Blastopirellula marina]RCS53813.1 hypothetical protein DTL36_08045 [Bremerella cremea]